MPPARRLDRLAVSLALAAAALALAAAVVGGVGATFAPLDVAFAATCVLAGVASLLAWRGGDRAERGRATLLALAGALPAFGLFALAGVVAREPIAAALEGIGVALVAVVLAALARRRRQHGRQGA